MSDFRNTRQESFPMVVKWLVIINAAVYFAQRIFDPTIDLTDRLALWPIGSPLFEAYQVFTHMFTHGSIGHIFFNMFALWMFGRILESVWGPKRFLNFY